MDEENQIEYLIKEIINMIKAGKTSSEIHRFYKPYLPDYMVYNAYHAANILLKDQKKYARHFDDITVKTKTDK
jgi:hypothetical protein